MKRNWILLVTCILYSCFAFGQQPGDSIGKKTSANFADQSTNINKVQLQQQLMLSRQKQLDINKQEQQKIILEKQKKQLAEKEKQLLELQVRTKQKELEQDRKTQTQVLQQNKIQARLDAAIKDKQINNQQAEIRYNKKWNLFLIIGIVVVAFLAVITYFAQRKAKRLNAVISSQHAELEQVGMVKDTILSVVSHDMRTPVNHLLAFSELIKDGDIPPDKLGIYLDQINLTLHHTSSLMNNLLNWAASQMQGFTTDITRVDAAAVASNIVASFTERANAKKIRITSEIEQGCFVLADANMMDLVLRNLVSNALKYTKANGSVTLASSVQGSSEIIVSVTDNGIGMTDDSMLLFNAEKLSSTKSTPGTEREKGTGLGLLLCKTFTGLMQGKISVKKNPAEQGCSFELRLPKG